MATLDAFVLMALLSGWLDSWMRFPGFVPMTAAQLLAFGLTFQPFSGPWRAAIRVTRRRVVIGRVLLATSAMVFAVSVGHLSVVGVLGDFAIDVFVSSLCLLMASYVALHWALRPENLLTVSIVRFLAPFSRRRSRQARRRV